MNAQQYEGHPIITDPPAADGWWTAYGAQVQAVGEDGDWIALGHIEPRRMLAAMLRAGREQLGLDAFELFGEFRPAVDPMLAAVEHRRAVFTVGGADWLVDEGWSVWWGDNAQQHPHAVDVTVWRA